MRQSKLIALFLTLTAAERRRFKKWVNSPIHNFNPRISKLYDFLDGKQSLTDRSVNREKAYSAVYGKQPYDDLNMRRLMSEFLDVLEAFLAYQQWIEKPTEHWLSMAKIYRQRQLPEEASTCLSKAVDLLNAQAQRDSRYFQDHYRLQEERLAQNPTRDSAMNLQEMSDGLARFFVAELLRNACSAASHAAIYKADYQLPYLEIILADCAAGRYDQVPLIRLYFHSYQCLTQPTASEHFFAYKNLLPEAAGWLSKGELRDTLLFGINYCIRRLNNGAAGFLREAFDLYKLGLQQEIFLENGLLSRFSYKNIVTAALKLGETDWVEQFLNTYTPLLAVEFREHYERFCRAKLSYQNGDFGLVQSLLHDLSFDDVFLELDARVLLLKIYFETSEWRLLEGFITAFERFVTRKKMLAYHAPNYRNIIQFTSKLMLWKSGKRNYTPEELSLLEEQIKQAKPLTEREWLLHRLTVHG